jgi:malonyl-CoA/methylmalonyl-CoA synthetase
VAVVVAQPGHSLNEGDVIAALKGEIANFKVPKRVHFVADLPRNAMGKVQKNLLRDKFGSTA